MSEQEKKAPSETEDLDRLRDSLLDGGFGAEDSTGGEDDTVADEAVVNNFVSMFGAKGDTPLKAHDWVAYIPSYMCESDTFWGPLFGIIREETESIYVFDSKHYEEGKYLIGYIDNGSYRAKTAYAAFEMPEGRKRLIGVYNHGNLVLKLTSDPDPTIDAIAALRAQLAGDDPYVVDQDGRVLNPADPMSVSSLSNPENFTPVDRAVLASPEWYPEKRPFSSYYGKEVFDVRIKTYDTVTNLFSRNTGLLESSIMLDKRAVLVGCGSVGSFVAMELARSGVGKFVLCDTDTLEIHNICRHQCGFDDLGRYKVDAVKDKILNINPNAEVITYRSIIQRVPEEELLPLLGRNTIIIGGGDNRGSADWACKLAIKTDSTFVSTCCWTRAFAGEIFYWASGRGLSCYSCALGGLIDDERPESHATYFGSDEEKESLSFEPGVAADIDFVTIIAIKLALDLLNRDNPNYTPRVINYLKQYTWVCNTNSTKIGGERAGIFPTPLWITNNLSVHKDENCPYCGNSTTE